MIEVDSSWSPFNFDDPWQRSELSAHELSSGLICEVDLNAGTLSTKPEISHGHTLEDAFEVTLTLPDLDAPSSPPVTASSSAGQSFHSFNSDAIPLSPLTLPNDPCIWPIEHESTVLGLTTPPKTWEAFTAFDKDLDRPSQYLAEAGEEVFNAVVQKLHPSCGALPQDAVIKAFYNLALGRSSAFFQWNTEQCVFTRTLKDYHISGLSAACSENVVNTFLEQGNLFRQIHDAVAFPDLLASQLPTTLALRHSIATALQTIEESLAAKAFRVKSLLEFQETMSSPLDLLKVLDVVICETRESTSDDAVISSVFRLCSTHVETADRSAVTMQALLRLVSVPYLEYISREIGLTTYSHQAALLVRSDAGSALNSSVSHPLHTISPGDVDSHGHTLLTTKDRELVRNAKAGLQILRDHDPSHPLISHGVGEISPPDCVHSLYIDNVIDRAAEYEANVRQAIEKFRAGSSRAAATHASMDLPSTAHDPWSTVAAQLDEAGLDIDDTFDLLVTESPVLEGASFREDFVGAIHATLKGQDEPTTRGASDIALGYTVSIMDNVRPFLDVQSRLVNRAVVEHLFHDCDLEQHFGLHRALFCFGNGEFIARLTAALFNSDTQSVVDRRHDGPTSQAPGLKLDGHAGQRWPPASSELNLSLLGILTDTLLPGMKASTGQKLPGNLSFSIRELSESQIDKASDPQSSHALDFLRLHYTAPPPLDAIFTLETSRRYDKIFRFLLLNVRMLCLAKQLRFSSLKERPNEAQKTSLRAVSNPHRQSLIARFHHFITVLASYALGTAIEPPWQRVISQLTAAKDYLAAQSSTVETKRFSSISIEGLREIHKGFVEEVSGRLFLRRRHEKVHKTIEMICDLILQSASILLNHSSVSGSADESSAFDRMFRQLLAQLEEIAEGLPKRSDSSLAESEADAARYLQCQLDWNGYYHTDNIDGG